LGVFQPGTLNPEPLNLGYTIFIAQHDKSQESKTRLDYQWANWYLERSYFWKGIDTTN
jgi:hypothetical protein